MKKKPIKRETHKDRRLPFIVAGMCCVIAFAATIVMARSSATVQTKSTTSGTATVRSSCKNHCIKGGNNWVTLKSEAPADVIAAAKQTDIYQEHASIANSSPVSERVSSADVAANAPYKQGLMDTPVLVKPYRDDVNEPTYWVIPLLNSAHRTFRMLAFIYDSTHHRLQAGGVGGGDIPGKPHKTYPGVSQASAIALVQSKEHVSIIMKGDKAPSLIYFPWSPYDPPRPGTFPWRGGGTSYSDPIWRIATTDGQYYYVDHLGKQVYTGKSLGVDSSYPPAL